MPIRKGGKYRHGYYGTSFYVRWGAVKSRCSNRKHPAYHRYGGRGIKHPWRMFEDFYNDMYDSYVEHVAVHGEKNTQLDRIDNNADYSKENCRWVTPQQNARNRNDNKWITFRGETKCLKEWAEIIGGSKNLLHERFRKGWSVDRALTTPPQQQHYNRSKICG